MPLYRFSGTLGPGPLISSNWLYLFIYLVRLIIDGDNVTYYGHPHVGIIQRLLDQKTDVRDPTNVITR